MISYFVGGKWENVGIFTSSHFYQAVSILILVKLA